MTERERGFATRAIHGAVAPPIDQETPSVPIYQTATYRFDTSEDYAETIASGASSTLHNGLIAK